jgi:hypothetical protein
VRDHGSIRKQYRVRLKRVLNVKAAAQQLKFRAGLRPGYTRTETPANGGTTIVGLLEQIWN